MKHTDDTIYRTATIRERDDAAVLTLELRLDADEQYRWYQDGRDTEVSGETIEAAIETAGFAWHDWDFQEAG